MRPRRRKKENDLAQGAVRPPRGDDEEHHGGAMRARRRGLVVREAAPARQAGAGPRHPVEATPPGDPAVTGAGHRAAPLTECGGASATACRRRGGQDRRRSRHRRSADRFPGPEPPPRECLAARPTSGLAGMLTSVSEEESSSEEDESSVVVVVDRDPEVDPDVPFPCRPPAWSPRRPTGRGGPRPHRPRRFPWPPLSAATAATATTATTASGVRRLGGGRGRGAEGVLGVGPWCGSLGLPLPGSSKRQPSTSSDITGLSAGTVLRVSSHRTHP